MKLLSRQMSTPFRFLSRVKNKIRKLNRGFMDMDAQADVLRRLEVIEKNLKRQSLMEEAIKELNLAEAEA